MKSKCLLAAKVGMDGAHSTDKKDGWRTIQLSQFLRYIITPLPSSPPILCSLKLGCRNKFRGSLRAGDDEDPSTGKVVRSGACVDDEGILVVSLTARIPELSIIPVESDVYIYFITPEVD
ncbi:hypothetical protein M747DRAFT_329975 [Aspergillus niger ATCC 13496]|uniref:Uncharacterized protein n=1 Tax=Aspergillus niger ATCC 13496 TaxID=1353008 RepID=A0A370C471_ASPNG|nr:hypothetical protein M747DRAFT_329975 [Aspergillus niger ATCC 13496]